MEGSPGTLPVVVFCNDAAGCERISKLIASSGALPRLVSATELPSVHEIGPGHIVLVAFGAAPILADGVLEAVRFLKHQGFTILALGERPAAWSVRTRCLLFLAGVGHLFDQLDPDFVRDLTHHLDRLFVANSTHAEQDCAMKQTMRKLGIIGESPSMLAIFRTLMRISLMSDLPVLLSGETGTGKERLARAIHALDPKRSKGPLITMNCASLAPTLAESELFGHRRGSFTGASTTRQGLFRAANGGVLFLDEIGELELPMQAKLLRVLQEHRVLGVGEEREVPISIRVVAATNRDLKTMVQQQFFRADLFHRLNVLSIHIPPLRERPSDIEPLANAFLAAREGASIASEALEALKQASLPGNVRQLESLICKALINKQTAAPLALSDFPPELWQELAETSSPSSEESVSIAKPSLESVEEAEPWLHLLQTKGGTLSTCLCSCERALVAVALRRSEGNRSKIAQLLGITPRSVYNKLRKHHLAQPM